MSTKVVALHGFLGKATDWNSVAPHLGAKRFEAIDLWPMIRASAAAEDPFDAFSELLVKHLRGESCIAIGYSMGGRLLMSTLLKHPKCFNAAVIVSANPGLEKEEEKRSRIENDKLWADCFLKEPWQNCLTTWNAQPVLHAPREPGADYISLNRVEHDFDRGALAGALTAFSLGRQRNMKEALTASSVPVLYVAGDEDAKFSKIARSMAPDLADSTPDSRSRSVVLKNAGHRLPWDAPTQFGRLIQAWPVYRSLIGI